jgi:hypothetical protein
VRTAARHHLLYETRENRLNGRVKHIGEEREEEFHEERDDDNDEREGGIIGGER